MALATTSGVDPNARPADRLPLDDIVQRAGRRHPRSPMPFRKCRTMAPRRPTRERSRSSDCSLTDNQKAAEHTAFDLISSYTGLKFVQASSATADAAAIRVAQTGTQNSSAAFFPYLGGEAAGDTVLSPTNGNVQAQYFGTDPLLTRPSPMSSATPWA